MHFCNTLSAAHYSAMPPPAGCGPQGGPIPQGGPNMMVANAGQHPMMQQPHTLYFTQAPAGGGPAVVTSYQTHFGAAPPAMVSLVPTAAVPWDTVSNHSSNNASTTANQQQVRLMQSSVNSSNNNNTTNAVTTPTAGASTGLKAVSSRFATSSTGTAPTSSNNNNNNNYVVGGMQRSSSGSNTAASGLVLRRTSFAQHFGSPVAPMSSAEPLASPPANSFAGNSSSRRSGSPAISENNTGGGGVGAGGVPTVEVYDADFKDILTIPVSQIVHQPHPSLGVSRLVLCRNYTPQTSQACAKGAACKFVHADITNAPRSSIHVNYAWRQLELCTYPRLPPGDELVVLAPNERQPSEIIPSNRVLVTRAALTRKDHADKLSHCAHYYFNRMCNRGERCNFIHAVYVDPNVQGDFKRAPAPTAVAPILAGGSTSGNMIPVSSSEMLSPSMLLPPAPVYVLSGGGGASPNMPTAAGAPMWCFTAPPPPPSPTTATIIHHNTGGGMGAPVRCASNLSSATPTDANSQLLLASLGGTPLSRSNCESPSPAGSQAPSMGPVDWSFYGELTDGNAWM